jgi:hypothetical protein
VFEGEINLNAAQSKPGWPARFAPPKGAPNIHLIMTDNVGFAAPSTFGSVIPAPALDRISTNGLRYTNFHPMSLCSPTRAAVLTQRKHHSVGFGGDANQLQLNLSPPPLAAVDECCRPLMGKEVGKGDNTEEVA